jgi:hypothetical protein
VGRGIIAQPTRFLTMRPIFPGDARRRGQGVLRFFRERFAPNGGPAEADKPQSRADQSGRAEPPMARGRRSLARAFLIGSRDRFCARENMRRGGMELWGRIAVNLVIYLGSTSAAKAQDADGKITLRKGCAGGGAKRPAPAPGTRHATCGSQCWRRSVLSNAPRIPRRNPHKVPGRAEFVAPE